MKIDKNTHKLEEFTDLDKSSCLLVSDCVLLTGKSVLSIPLFIQPSDATTTISTTIESFLQWLSQTEAFYAMKILTVDEYPSQIKAPISFTRILYFLILSFFLISFFFSYYYYYLYLLLYRSNICQNWFIRKSI